MKSLVWCIFSGVLLAGVSSVAASISGFVTRDNNGYIFIESTTQKHYELKPANQTASQDLAKLSNFDSITGEGVAVGKGILYDVMLLDGVDFVGLRQLLGLWTGPNSILEFIDYNEVSFYFPSGSSTNLKLPKKTFFHYSLSPTTGDTWRVFFADDNSVTLGSLSIKGENAVIELYDQNTGEVTQTISLQKVKP